MPAFNIIEDFQVKTNQAFLEKAAALEPVLHQTAVAAAGIVHRFLSASIDGNTFSLGIIL